MKAFVSILFLLSLTYFTTEICAEENYWDNIKKLQERADSKEKMKTAEDRKALSETWKKYLKSLTADQLITAGRQCGREFQKAIDANQPGVGDGAFVFGFFSDYYPQATNDLRDISPILQEISDKTQPAIWRSQLIEMLLGRRWDAKLTNEQRLQIFDCLGKVLNDKTDSVRGKIPLRMARMLSKIHKDYVNALKDNSLDSDMEKKLKLFTENINKYLESNQMMFSDAALSASFRGKILAGMVVCYKEELPGSSSVKDLVVNTFSNYRNCPESLWPQLALHAIDDFQMENAKEILDEMIRNSTDESIKRGIQGIRNRQREKIR